MSEHTKGELHAHSLAIHIEYSENGKVIDHTCIANMNPVGTAYGKNLKQQETNAEHLVKCWNCHDDLVAACEKYQRMIELLFELNPKVEIVLGSALGLKQAEETGKAALARSEKCL